MTQQEDANLEYNLYRIICGYYYIEINNTKYKAIYPTIEIKYRAEQIYRETLDQYKFDTNWISDLQLQILLDSNNIWTSSNAKELSQQKSALDLEKIDLYKNFSNTSQRKKHKKKIVAISSSINSLHNKKDSLNYLTLKHFANSIKNEFIILNCLLDNNNKKIIKNIDNFSNIYNSSFAISASKEILDNQIQVSELKKLARSDIWRSYYNEHSAFPKSSIEANDDYRHLVSLTKMYDQIRQHPECPPDDIIEDDDALDGWFIYQKQKTLKEKQKNQILDKVGGNKIKNAGEVFVVTQDQNEARTVFGMNDEKSLKDMKHSIQLANEKGSVSWTSLEHVIDDKLREQGKAGYKEIK